MRRHVSIRSLLAPRADAALNGAGHLVGDRRRSQHRPRRHRVGDVRRSRRSVPDGRAGGGRARQGRAACQAGVDGTHKNQMLVFQELQKGTDPKQIIEMLAADPAFQSRQFGILDLQGRMAGHSGLTNGYVSQDIQGQVPGTEIFYSIQGNILRPGQVVPNAVQAFLKTQGAITDRVMAAMEAADGSGGDSRCDCPPWPTDGTKPKIPCDGRTSHVAYILMAEKGDTNGDSHNNGKYAMYITVSQPGADKGPGQVKRRRESQPGQDAARALRRVAQEAAGVVQISETEPCECMSSTLVVGRRARRESASGRPATAGAAARRRRGLRQTPAGPQPGGPGGRTAAGARSR